MSPRDPTWTDYYEANDDRDPREMLLQVLDAFGPAGHEAVDLGCGSGIDTLAMLRRGWRVLATDAEAEAIERVVRRVPPELADRLRTERTAMEDVELPGSDLVWAGFSLFFCDPDRFGDVWDKVRTAIRPGGRFAGQLLGERDTWAGDEGISSFTRSEAHGLFEGWEVERFDEEDEDGEACSGPKHWHVFHVVARRPDQGRSSAPPL